MLLTVNSPRRLVCGCARMASGRTVTCTVPADPHPGSISPSKGPKGAVTAHPVPLDRTIPHRNRLHRCSPFPPSPLVAAASTRGTPCATVWDPTQPTPGTNPPLHLRFPCRADRALDHFHFHPVHSTPFPFSSTGHLIATQFSPWNLS